MTHVLTLLWLIHLAHKIIINIGYINLKKNLKNLEFSFELGY